MKIRIEEDERWPDFDFTTDAESLSYGYTEVNGNTVKRWRRVIDEYNQVQHEMAVSESWST